MIQTILSWFQSTPVASNPPPIERKTYHPSRTDKLYIIVDQRLRPGAKMAQACHAMRAFADQHPEIEKAWFANSNNIVILQVEDLNDLADFLDSEGYAVARFHEPDFDNRLTALAVEPNAWRQLSHIRLAA